jgi:trans-aconitate methyltransferase
MEAFNFSALSQRYMEASVVQNSASDILLDLLDIRNTERVLDVGCGTGNLTKKIKDLTQASVTGVDPSSGMINESVRNFGKDIRFIDCPAENLNFEDEFDVIFCNSTFQWLTDYRKALKNFHRALRFKGRIGIQAPAGWNYCPNFINAVNSLNNIKSINKIFSHFKSPWLFFNNADEYSSVFRENGFNAVFSNIQSIRTMHSPEEVYGIFSSGAIAGYLNQAYYDCELNDEYLTEFEKLIKMEFDKQAGTDGMVELVFNRIYLVAVKAREISAS